MAIKINGNTVIDDSQNFTSTGTLSATGNVTGGNIRTAGTISATGNITAGNIIANVVSSGPVSTTGNVTGGNVLTGGVVSATGAITGSTLTAGGFTLSGNTITSSGSTLTIDPSTSGIEGNVVIAGNLSVQGNVTYIDSTVITTNEKDIVLANNVNTQAAVNGAGILLGNNSVVTFTYGNTANAWLSNVGLSAAGNVTGGNLSGTNISGTLTTASQTNITAVGTLTSLNSGAISSSGNVTGANLLTAGLISSTGNITGGNISATNHTGTTVSVTGNVIGGNVTTAGLISATGAITGAALTGTSLTVSTGNITAGNLLLSGAIIDSAQLDIQTSASNSNIALAPNGTGIVTVSTQVSAVGNVTGGNISTAGLITATGNIQGGNLRTAGLISATGAVTASQFNGSAAGLTGAVLSLANGGGITASASTGAITLGSTATSSNTGSAIVARDGSGNFSAGTITATLSGAATTAGTVTTAAQPNITSVGTLSGLTINNATTAITNGAASGSGNIGASGATFNTVFAKATTAQYADLAEKYIADAEYVPGTVLVFGGNQEVTISSADSDTRVAGVVSTDPGFIMNEGLTSEFVVAIALTGRVPTKVTGTVRKGDLMVSAGNGVARAEANPRIGTVIGKALADYDGESGVIEVVVGRF